MGGLLGLGLGLSLAVVVFSEDFLRTEDAHQPWVPAGERQAFSIPKQNLVAFVVRLFGEGRIGGIALSAGALWVPLHDTI